MASNDVQVLNSAAAVEKLTKNLSGFALDRRHFMAALGVAGAAAGTTLVSSPAAFAQQPKPNGFLEVDVLNFLLNIKYLKATFYSYIITGKDIAGSAGVTVGTGGVFNAPAQVTFSGTNGNQINDMFNEMYFDELNQLIDLRNLLGNAVFPRQTINLLGTSAPNATFTTLPATATLTQPQAIAMARMLEDVSTSAFAGAAIYLTGKNLSFATQVLAADGFHAGAVRLVSIQTGATYQGTGSQISFQVGSVVGSTTLAAVLPVPPPFPLSNLVGDAISGAGIPSGAVVTAVNSVNSAVPTGITVKGSNIINTVSSVAGLAPGQPINGGNIPPLSVIQSVGTNTITLAAPAVASGSTTVSPTGFTTNTSNIITGVSSVTGLLVGQAITGTGIVPGATITAIGSKTPFTITMSAPANATSTVKLTGTTTTGSLFITAVSSVSGLIAGQVITGAGIPLNATISAVGTNTITLSVPATATSAISGSFAFSGITTSGSNIITAPSNTSGLIVGQPITGPGIPPNTTITAIGAATVTISAPATADSPAVKPTGILTYGSNVITSVSSISGLVVGQIITGPGIPTGTTITAASGSTITISAPATTIPSGLPVALSSPGTVALASPSGEALSSPTTVVVTTPTTEVLTIGQSTITISLPATALGSTTALIAAPDPQDVAPADQGTAALAALGPALVPSSSPALYQGFFNTAGAGTTSATSTPPGFAFARSFSQVLSVLYGSSAIQTFEGGFFPVGVSGNINVV